ncbi:MAG: hypothetical protein ABDH28_01905 [Brevinematia bacterium]
MLNKMQKLSQSLLETLQEVYNILLKDGLSRNYKTYKVTFYLQTPIALSWPFIHLDGIMLHRYLLAILGQKYYYVHTARIDLSEIFKVTLGKTLEEEGYMPVVDKWKDLYKATALEFGMHKRHVEVLYKRFEDRFYEKGTVRIGTGTFRSFAEKFIYINPKMATGVIRMDAKWVELLYKIPALGDDTRTGWGIVKKVEVEELNDEFVIVQEGIAKRVIPVDYLKYYKGKPIGIAYKPPYWLIDNVNLCVIPGTEVEIKEDEKDGS